MENPRMPKEALVQAEARTLREGTPCVVYYLAGPDQFGRRDVWYVRTESEGAPLGASEVYRTLKPAPTRGEEG